MTTCAALASARQSIGNVPLTLWKSDIADIYHLLPVSLHWQVKQIVTIDGEHYVDHNLYFGSSASPGIIISFNSLVGWIAKNVKDIKYLFEYVDNSSGCNLLGDTLFYEPYGMYFPSNQTQLLQLWDELGIPHKPHKQIFGCPLTIISIEVNANRMTLTFAQESKQHLGDELKFWVTKPPKSSSGSFKLKYWECLTGWFNWALNVYPSLRPMLSNVYTKMNGKHNKEQHVYINNAIRDDFMWALSHIERSSSVQQFKSISWTPSLADFRNLL